MKRHIAGILLVGAVLLTPCQSLKAQDSPAPSAVSSKEIDASIGTEWFGVYFQGKKIGYAHNQVARVGDRVEQSMTMSMKLASFNQKIELKMTQKMSFDNKAPFRLMEVTSEEENGASKTRTHVRRTDKGFDHAIDVAGQKRTKLVEDLGLSLADSIALETWMRTNPAVGKELTTRDIDVKEWKMETTRHTLKATKSSLVAGVDVKFAEVESLSNRNMLKYLQRIGGDGRLISGQIAIFELRRETEAEAKNTEFSRDLFVFGMAKADRALGHATKLRELIVEVDAKEGEVFKNGPLQSVTVKENGTRIIKLGKKYANPTKVGEKEIKENLAETADYLITDPSVIALATKAMGDARTPEEKVKNIVNYVYGFIKPKMVASLPTLPDLLRRKEGDCKCYALLTTTLCRAVGVPSREVTGLVYMGDDVKAFGGHAWNEVVLNGVWVPVDASLNQVELDAGHISYGDKRSSSGSLLSSLGKISFRVIDSQSN